MSLTRSMLKEMALTDDQVEQIILAHLETVDALKAEITAAQEDRALLTEQLAELAAQQQDAASIQAEFDRYKAQMQAQLSAEEIQRILRDALIKAGANEKAVMLLSREIDPEAAQIDGGKLTNAEELIAPIREKYAAFFATPVSRPVPTIQPPATLHGSLTRQDVARMTTEEINQNWDAVRSVLTHA